MSFILLRRDLSQNQIEDLPSKAFGNCHQLVYLHLDFNNMTELRNETFEGLRNLEDLVFEHNSILSIQKGKMFSNSLPKYLWGLPGFLLV